jgi:hypothetical protein
MLLLATACGEDEDPNPVIPVVSAVDQTLTDAGTVRVARVDADRAGFVAIYVDAAGQRGTYLGSTSVGRGRSDDVDVELDTEVPENTRLRATLHLDTGVRGVFEFPTDPSLDPPVTDSTGAEVETAFEAVIAVQGAALEASDQTPSELSVLSIDRVETATAGFVRVVQSVDGAPTFPSIGLAPAPAGRHLDLPVSLERDTVDGETVFAFLHEDSNGNGELDWTGFDGSADPPIEGDDGEPLRASITISSTVSATETVLVDDLVATSSTADIRVKSVISDEDGFVAVYGLDEQGELELPARAHVIASAGLTPLLALDDVPVGSSTTAMELEAVLHRDSDQDGVFEYDGGLIDPPAELPGGGRVSARFEVSRQVQ